MILNRQKRRGNYGRAGDQDRARFPRAWHALDVWAVWQSGRREYGWPKESSEVRAFYAAQTASQGQRRDDSVRQGVGIPQCKETRSRAHSIVPEIDRARLGPRIHRLLLDMDAEGLEREAQALRLTAIAPRLDTDRLAKALGMSRRTYFRLKSRGSQELDKRIAACP